MILDNLVNGQTQLSKSERRIAAIVLNNPSKVINQSISDLSIEADVSLPTVNRFCKKLGLEGYPALKIQIAQELSNTNRMLIENFEVENHLNPPKQQKSSWCCAHHPSKIIFLQNMQSWEHTASFSTMERPLVPLWESVS